MCLMNKKINIVSFFVLIFGCTRENPIGYVSQPVSVTINISEDNNDLEFTHSKLALIKSISITIESAFKILSIEPMEKM